MYRDWTQRKAYIVKRHPIAVVVGIFALAIVQFIFIPMASLEYLDITNNFQTSTLCTTFVRIPLSIVPTTAAVSIGVIRLWLLYYDIHLSKYQLKKAWSAVISSPNSGINLITINDSTQKNVNANVDANVNVQSNWFDKHQKTVGNATYLVVITCIIIFVVTLLDFSLYLFLDESAASIFVASYFAMGLIAMVLFYYKLKNSYFDELGIRKEMKYSSLLLSPCVVILLVNNIAFAYMDSYRETEYCVIHAWNLNYGCCVAFAYWTMFGKYKVWKDTQETKNSQGNTTSNDHNVTRQCCCCCNWCWCDNIVFHTTLELTQGATSNGSKSRSGSSNGSSFGSRWSDIVCCQLGYESLVNHLAKEFSIENALFITEVCLHGTGLCRLY